MKIKFFFVIILICVISNGIFAQSSNNEQRIIGTWTVLMDDIHNLINSVWTFNSNGTGTTRLNGENITFNFIIAGPKIFINLYEFGIFDINFSSDGRFVILSTERYNGGMALRKN